MNRQSYERKDTMNKVVYGVMWEDENALVWGFADSAEEAMQTYAEITGEPLEELESAYYARSFTPEEAKETENWPDV